MPALQHCVVQRIQWVMHRNFHENMTNDVIQVNKRHARPAQTTSHRCRWQGFFILNYSKICGKFTVDYFLSVQLDAYWHGDALSSQWSDASWLYRRIWCEKSIRIRISKFDFQFGDGKLGIINRNDIGFISWDPDSNFMVNLNLGSRLKTPILPIWVSCIKGNWGVLFNPNKDLMKSYSAENR